MDDDDPSVGPPLHDRQWYASSDDFRCNNCFEAMSESMHVLCINCLDQTIDRDRHLFLRVCESTICCPLCMRPNANNANTGSYLCRTCYDVSPRNHLAHRDEFPVSDPWDPRSLNWSENQLDAAKLQEFFVGHRPRRAVPSHLLHLCGTYRSRRYGRVARSPVTSPIPPDALVRHHHDSHQASRRVISFGQGLVLDEDEMAAANIAIRARLAQINASPAPAHHRIRVMGDRRAPSPSGDTGALSPNPILWDGRPSNTGDGR